MMQQVSVITQLTELAFVQKEFGVWETYIVAHIAPQRSTFQSC